MRIRGHVPATVFVALLTALGLASCGHKTPENQTLLPTATPPVADIPVPANFHLDTNRGGSKQWATGLRWVNHYYSGREDFLPTAAFYREQMPKNGWTFVDVNHLGSDIVQHYTKGAETVTVTISEGTLATHIHILLEAQGKKEQ